MNRNLQLAILILVLLTTLAIFLSACSNANFASLEDLQTNCIRIHIRANSNSAEDQAVKLKVRDAITAYLTDALDGAETKQQAARVIENNKQKLRQIADTTLYQSGFAYKTSVRLNNEYFPDKEYDGYTFPAGRYDALIVELGSGKGDNWWCVAFPPLCFVPSTGPGEKIVYKSWVKEMLDKLFG